jgi:hypothetical protein
MLTSSPPTRGASLSWHDSFTSRCMPLERCQVSQSFQERRVSSRLTDSEWRVQLSEWPVRRQIYRCTPLPLLDMYVRKSGLRYQWQPSSLRAISGTVEVKWEVSRDSRVPRHHLCIVHGTVRYGALRYAASCCPLMPLSASVVSA